MLTLDRRTILGFVQHAGKRPEPLFYLRPVDGDYAQLLRAQGNNAFAGGAATGEVSGMIATDAYFFY
ncbi:hypothetical protein AUQ29_20915 [Escherichia coli]|nr:hypothetical protein AUQ29_20915 [Escherichia coli]